MVERKAAVSDVIGLKQHYRTRLSEFTVLPTAHTHVLLMSHDFVSMSRFFLIPMIIYMIVIEKDEEVNSFNVVSRCQVNVFDPNLFRKKTFGRNY